MKSKLIIIKSLVPIARHSITGKPIVEILKDDRVVGVIYPTNKGIRIVSAHITEIIEHPNFQCWTFFSSKPLFLG